MTGDKKQQTHDRILRAAARAIRAHGYSGASVADIMKDAGLTHGGFYAHFDSREAMLAEALDHAADDARTTLLEGARLRGDAGDDPLEALVATYLSDRHASATDGGCALAALGSETRRQGPEIRHVATRRLKDLLALIARAKGKRDVDELAVLSTLVGALVLARAVDDPALSKQIRAAARRAVLDE